MYVSGTLTIDPKVVEQTDEEGNVIKKTITSVTDEGTTILEITYDEDGTTTVTTTEGNTITTETKDEKGATDKAEDSQKQSSADKQVTSSEKKANSLSINSKFKVSHKGKKIIVKWEKA